MKIKKSIYLQKKSMNDLLIIGNGFDLDLGLKTDYSNFVESSYFQEHVHSNNILFSYLNGVHKDKKWIDIENQIKEFAKKQFYVRYHKSVKEEFKFLKDALYNYLLSIKYDVNPNSVGSKVLSAVLNGFAFKKIYSYNYTDLEEIIRKLHIKKNAFYTPPIEHVHGCINDKSIILGFEDIANVNKEYLFMIKSFSPYYQSHSIQHDLMDAREIIFFGHSLGSTDYLYFENLFENQSNKLLKKEYSKKITIFTRNDKSRVEILTQLREMNKNRTDLLFGLNKLNIFCTEEKTILIK